VERAFFYLDEMKSLGIEPTRDTFHALFRACATAPHWVNGYNDVIFDAMDAMEGCELPPTVETYNCVIHAFARARDAVAAEYYFWEMIRKGMQPDKETYASLLRAHAEAQSVGAHKYGSRGRYCRPTPPPPTADEQAMLDVGPQGVAEIMSAGIMSEFDPQPGKRVKPKLTDLLDDEMPEERDRQVMQAIRLKAHELNGSLRDYSPEEGAVHDDEDDAEEVDIYELAKNDPHLRALLSEAERGDPNFIQSLSSLQDSQDGEGRTEGDDYADKSGDISRRPRHELRGEDPEKAAAEGEERLMRALLGQETRFVDPFAHLADSKCRSGPQRIENEGKAYQPQHSSLVMLLDRMQSRKDDSVEDSVNSVEERGPITDAYVQEQWELLHFGRAPNTEFHNKPLGARRKQNVMRAQHIFEHMLAQNIQPDVKIMNELLAVHAEAVHVDDALAVLDRFSKFGVEPNERTYRYLIQMHVRNGDINAAVQLKDEMKQTKGIIPHKDSYGLILQSLTHREMLVEALKVLEEASLDQRRIPEGHLRYLRSRCEKLGIKHPNIPADPKQWVKDTKEMRSKLKHAPQSRIEHVRTKLFS